MTIPNVIEFVVNSQPENKMIGRKRLHKLILLGAIASGDDFGNSILEDSEFYIHHYGVYSKVVARSLDSLVFDGLLQKQSEPLGVFGSLVDTYEKDTEVEISSTGFNSVIQTLSGHNTVMLEVAANIAFHINSGKDLERAIIETRELKPVKSEKYLSKSLNLLEEIGILD